MTAVVTGATPQTLAGSWSLPELAELARARMSPQAFDYCCGGAGDEATVARNVARLDDLVLTPRVGERAPGPASLDTDLLGSPLAAPLLVAPMGLQALCCDEGEVGSAAAAASLGVGHCLSTFSSRTPEEVAAAVGDAVRWFQLYVLRDWDITASLLARAEAAGFRAIVVTVDVPAVGVRWRDARNRFDRFGTAAPALLRDPAFTALLARRGGPGQAKELLDDVFPNAECGWADVRRVVRATRLPVLVKGVLHPDDVRRAADAGARGVILSNHGGRQFDRSISSAEALSRLRRTGLPDIPVLLDSGIRRASHIAAALALGASAVLVGRPALWGLAIGGRAGCRRVLELLLADLAHLMRIAGAGGVADLRAVEVDGTAVNGMAGGVRGAGW